MIEYKTNIPKYSLVKEPTDIKKVKINCSRDLANYARQFYKTDIEIYESFFLVLLNRANNTTGYVKISQGGTAGTVVDLKILAYYAIKSISSAIALVHNHPSGETKPSNQDRDITKKIVSGLKLLDVTVLDHIIIGPDEKKYFSFADEGLL